MSSAAPRFWGRGFAARARARARARCGVCGEVRQHQRHNGRNRWREALLAVVPVLTGLLHLHPLHVGGERRVVVDLVDPTHSRLLCQRRDAVPGPQPDLHTVGPDVELAGVELVVVRRLVARALPLGLLPGPVTAMAGVAEVGLRRLRAENECVRAQAQRARCVDRGASDGEQATKAVHPGGGDADVGTVKHG